MTPKDFLEAELYELYNDAEHAYQRTQDARVAVRHDNYAMARDALQGAQRAAEQAAAHARWSLERLDAAERTSAAGGSDG